MSQFPSIVEEAIKNTVDKIRTFITRYGEVGIRPNGDFEIIFSLPMFNEYLKKVGKEWGNGKHIKKDITVIKESKKQYLVRVKRICLKEIWNTIKKQKTLINRKTFNPN